MEVELFLHAGSLFRRVEVHVTDVWHFKATSSHWICMDIAVVSRCSGLVARDRLSLEKEVTHGCPGTGRSYRH